MKPIKLSTLLKIAAGLYCIGFILWQGIFFFKNPRLFEDHWRKNFIVRHIINERETVKAKVPSMLLSFHKPSFPILAEFVKDPSPISNIKGTTHGTPQFYYLQATQLFPNIAEAHSMLGVCYYYNTDRGSALSEFQKAIELLPADFWPYYNSGVILFEQGKYKEAVDQLQRAINIPLDVSQSIIHSSSIYRQVWAHLPQAGEVVTKNLVKARIDSLKLTVLSLWNMKQFREAAQFSMLALEKNWGDSSFFNLYAGKSFAALGAWPTALPYLKTAFDQNPTSVDSLDEMSRAAQALGNQPLHDQIQKMADHLRQNPQTKSAITENFPVRFF